MNVLFGLKLCEKHCGLLRSRHDNSADVDLRPTCDRLFVEVRGCCDDDDDVLMFMFPPMEAWNREDATDEFGLFMCDSAAFTSDNSS